MGTSPRRRRGRGEYDGRQPGAGTRAGANRDRAAPAGGNGRGRVSHAAVAARCATTSPRKRCCWRVRHRPTRPPDACRGLRPTLPGSVTTYCSWTSTQTATQSAPGSERLLTTSGASTAIDGVRRAAVRAVDHRGGARRPDGAHRPGAGADPLCARQRATACGIRGGAAGRPRRRRCPPGRPPAPYDQEAFEIALGLLGAARGVPDGAGDRRHNRNTPGAGRPRRRLSRTCPPVRRSAVAIPKYQRGLGRVGEQPDRSGDRLDRCAAATRLDAEPAREPLRPALADGPPSPSSSVTWLEDRGCLGRRRCRGRSPTSRPFRSGSPRQARSVPGALVVHVGSHDLRSRAPLPLDAGGAPGSGAGRSSCGACGGALRARRHHGPQSADVRRARGPRRRARQRHRDRAVAAREGRRDAQSRRRTFGALQQYSAGPKCVGQAVEIELGDVTGPAGDFVPDGKLDVYVACTPYVVRLTGDGTGALGSPSAFQMYLPPYRAPRRSTSSPSCGARTVTRPRCWRCSIRSEAPGVSCASAMSWIRRHSCAVPRRCRDRWPSATSTERSRACRPTRS